MVAGALRDDFLAAALAVALGDPRAKAFGVTAPAAGAPEGAIVPLQLAHQQGFDVMKFSSACHLGGAWLNGVTVSYKDSSAPKLP